MNKEARREIIYAFRYSKSVPTEELRQTQKDLSNAPANKNSLTQPTFPPATKK